MCHCDHFISSKIFQLFTYRSSNYQEDPYLRQYILLCFKKKILCLYLLGLTWRRNNRDESLKEKRHVCKLIKETLMHYNIEIYLNSILLNILKDQMNYTWSIWIICPKETRVTFLSVTWYDKVSMFYSKILNSKMICMHYSFFELSEKTERNSLSMTQSHLLYIKKLTRQDCFRHP